jgi:hypothetical protein
MLIGSLRRLHVAPDPSNGAYVIASVEWSLSSEGTDARACSERLQRRLPLLSRAAHREAEIEQRAHISSIEIEGCRGHRIIGLNGSKAELPAVAARKVVSRNQSVSRIRLDS